MKTTKRLFWSIATAVGIAAATAGPSFAGAAFNHTELLTTR
ncbi:hypothetical protein [Arthrobacter sp. Z1-9]